MILKFNNLYLRLHENESALVKLCEKKLHAPCRYFKILKKSLDARDKGDIKWVYSVECSSHPYAPPIRTYEQVKTPPQKVFVVGAGPAGLFCAVRLLRHGVKPILVERGKRVEERVEDVERFRKEGVLNPSSNVQFGEGGAGTFSDGKLNTQTHDSLGKEVLETFVEFGAPQEIAYLNKPHIGSDKLKSVIVNLRNYILERGGEIRFSTTLTDVEIKNGRVSAVYLNGVREEAQEVVLAVGHSARDTFEKLYERGFKMEQKEFAVGVRVEHLQETINAAQYGACWKALPPADYKLVSHAGERATFSFCMCPGGEVVASASEEGGLAVNGMSNYARDGKNANAALVVQVKKEDFEGEHPLAGVAFQRKLERAAFSLAGGGYRAPVQLLGDFLLNKGSTRFGQVLPTYTPQTAFVPMQAIFPKNLITSLQLAIPDMDRRLIGFAQYDAVLTGVESRTSSPVRILRDENLQSSVLGVYPCGEGCGYAGGITSAAVDGMRVALAIVQKYV